LATAIHGPGSKAKARLIAFGKHPGWDDHIEDIGLETDALVAAKRLLYTEGLAGNIDSASWERLEEGKRLPGFHHLFFWRLPQGWLIGRMWDSKDGKGRTKYPMTFAAMIEGAPAAWAFDQILPILAGLESKVTQTGSAEMVRFCAGEARAKLDAAAAQINGGGGSDEQALLARLVADPAMDADGQNQLGLARVFYEMERELSAFRRGTMLGRPKTSGAEAKASHMRVPRPFARPGDSSRAWVALLDREIDPTTPVLCFEPEADGFVDVIVGEPGPSQLFCVKASRSGVGLTTDVPYSLDASFLGLARAKAEGCRTSTGVSGLPTAGESKTATDSTKKPWLRWVLGGGAAVVVGGIALAVFGGGDDDRKKAVVAGADSKPADSVSTPAAPVVPAPAVQEPKKDFRSEPDPVTAPPAVSPVLEKAPAGVPDVAPATKPDAVVTVNEKPPAVATPVQPPVAKPVEEAPVAEPAPSGDVLVLGSYTPADPRAGWTIESDVADVRAGHARLTAERAALKLPSKDTVQKELSSAIVFANRTARKDFSLASKNEIAAAVSAIDETLAGAKGQVDAGLGEVASAIAREIAVTAAPVKNPTLVSEWAGALAKVPTTDGRAKAVAGVVELGKDFKSIEDAAAGMKRPAPPARFGTPAKWTADVDAKVAAALTEAASKASERNGAAGRQAIADYNIWAEQAAAFSASVDAAAESLDRGEAPDGKLADSAFAADFAGVVETLNARGAALRATQNEVSPAKLIDTIVSPASSHETVVAAWRRLATLPWPTGPQDLPRVVELSDGPVDAAAAKLDAAAGNGAAQADRGRISGEMWRKGAARVSGPADVDLVQSTLAPCGLAASAIDDLPGSVRYNILLSGIETAVRRSDAKSAVPKDALDEFLRSVNGLPAETRQLAAVIALLAELRTAASAPVAPDFAKMGPGSKGWTVQVKEDSVTYAGNGQTIEFRKVTTDGHDAMVATTEVSIDLFSSQWAAVSELFDAKAESELSRGGVVAWRVKQSKDGLRVSGAWLVKATTPNYYGAVKVPGPTGDVPMHRVGAAASVAFAAGLGCRWPSAAEWSEAARQDSGPANVYDRDFAAVEAAKPEPDPRLGSFAKAPAAAPAAADGFMWFAPVTHGNGAFKNTIGNVAEFVAATRFEAEGLAARPATELRAANSFAKCGVIGGSAMSEGGTSDQQPINLATTRLQAGFADVGFRLAFTIGQSGPPPVSSEAVSKAIARSGYLAAPER